MSQQDPSTSWSENDDPDEEILFKEFAIEIEKKQKKVANPGQVLRGFHSKIHAGFKAEFEVLHPAEPAVPYAYNGIFKEYRKFDSFVRFSNGSQSIKPDKKADPRGIAVKIMGIEGIKLLPGHENDKTQDFLATSHSLTSTVRNARQFIAFIRGKKSIKGLIAMIKDLGFGETMRILYALVRTVLLSKVYSMATEEYFGTAPIKYGPYAVKYTFRPAKKEEKKAIRPNKKDPNFLRNDLAARLKKENLVFDFLVQFYIDEKSTPIEDTSILWKPEVTQFVKVARLTIPKCDLNEPSSDEMSCKIEHLSFNPWHAADDHRPLGSIMRARKIAYQASLALRCRC